MILYDPLDVFCIRDFHHRYHRGEFLDGGGNFMSALDWVSYKCRQLLRLLTDNDNSTQLYQKRFSSRGEPSLLRQVTLRSWTRTSPGGDRHPDQDLNQRPERDQCPGLVRSRSEVSPVAEVMVLRDY